MILKCLRFVKKKRDCCKPFILYCAHKLGQLKMDGAVFYEILRNR